MAKERRTNHQPMEIKLVIRRQHQVTFEEEEAQDIRAFLNGLQESDYELPLKRNHVTDPERRAKTIKAVGHLREALQSVPAAHSTSDTRRL